MSQHDMIIANQTFPATRSDINGAFQALASTSIGTTPPSTQYAGQFWIDSNTPSTSLRTLYNYDGTIDIACGVFDTTDHRYYPATRMTPGGRLTLTTSVAATTSDVTAATTVYYTPHHYDLVPIYVSAANNTAFAFWVPEKSLALDSNSGHTGYHQSGKNFDLFVFLDGSTVRLGTGPAWATDTSRGTGAGTTELARPYGMWTNANTMTVRFGTAAGNTVSVAVNEATYVGTIRCTGDGQTEDSLVKRFVWNAYNAVRRPMARFESTDSWNYSSSAAWQQANAAAANQLDFVIGLNTHAVEATVAGAAVNSGATARRVSIAVGLDSATTPATECLLGCGSVTNAIASFMRSHYEGYPGIGRHYLTWLEIGAGSDTQSWFGDNGETTMKNGIVGSVFA